MSFCFEVRVRKCTHVLVVIFVSFIMVVMTLLVVIVKHGARGYFIVLCIEATETVINVKATDVALQSSVEAFTFIAGLLFSGQVGDSLFDISFCNRIVHDVDDAAARAITVQ